MRQRISKSAVDRLRPGESLADTNPIGFVARRLPSGAVTYGYRYRDKRSGQQRWIGLGIHGAITADQARKRALRLAGEVRDGADPVAEGRSVAAVAAKRRASGNTVNGLLDNFVTRYVRPNLRSAAEVERTFARYVRPRIGHRSIYDLRRLDIVSLLDDIEDNNGPVMADRTLAHLRKAFNWQAARDDTFVPPMVRGMARTKPKERARDRILSDDEIRAVWAAAAGMNGFGHFVKYLLLTTVRRDEAANMRRSEVEGDVWVVPAARHKSKHDHEVILSKTAQAVLHAAPKIGNSDLVFTHDGERAIGGFSKFKRKLDERSGVKGWTLHDLRRTARSLMSRAGVSSDHAERTLGHVIGGVRGTYDRHAYQSEKKVALEKLAALLHQILNPGAERVRFLKSR